MQLCDGATPEEQKKWRLQPANTFRYLNRSTCFTLARVDNAEEYRVCSCIPMWIPLSQLRSLVMFYGRHEWPLLAQQQSC